MKAIKKPIEIECMRLTLDSVQEVMQWCPACEPKFTMYESGYLNSSKQQYSRIFEGLIIHTLEGDHLAKVGDYIIKGVRGEFYPCKSDIFEQTYDVVNEWWQWFKGVR